MYYYNMVHSVLQLTVIGGSFESELKLQMFPAFCSYWFKDTQRSLMSCTDYPNSVYPGLMHGDHSGSGSLSVPADRLMPVHPDVRLKPLPFYDVLAEVLKPSTLSEFLFCSCSEDC